LIVCLFDLFVCLFVCLFVVCLLACVGVVFDWLPLMFVGVAGQVFDVPQSVCSRSRFWFGYYKQFGEVCLVVLSGPSFVCFGGVLWCRVRSMTVARTTHNHMHFCRTHTHTHTHTHSLWLSLGGEAGGQDTLVIILSVFNALGRLGSGCVHVFLDVRWFRFVACRPVDGHWSECYLVGSLSTVGSTWCACPW